MSPDANILDDSNFLTPAKFWRQRSPDNDDLRRRRRSSDGDLL